MTAHQLQYARHPARKLRSVCEWTWKARCSCGCESGWTTKRRATRWYREHQLAVSA